MAMEVSAAITWYEVMRVNGGRSTFTMYYIHPPPTQVYESLLLLPPPPPSPKKKITGETI